jgi:hypothetical protein
MLSIRLDILVQQNSSWGSLWWHLFKRGMGEVGIIGEIVLRKIGKLQNGEDVLK